MKLQYRRDIQALRGIAVSMVVLYHLEIAGFSSGFLGVDAFFVISGYLMAVMYNPDAKADFFLKRAKRLLPAYFAITAATLLLAAFIVTPIDYRQTVEQAAFASTFLSNIGFWLQNSYFDKTAFKPLLHLWSLAVEIQFYALVPLVSWALRKSQWNGLLLAATSLVICALVTGISPKTSFFLLPFRLWEFVLGFAVAGWAMRSPMQKKLLSTWIGAAAVVVMVVTSFLRIDGNTPSFVAGHPGLAALLMCTATATVLLAGIPASFERNPAFTLLEKLGDYSYSIYLAHFPVIVLYLYTPFSGTILTASRDSQVLALLALITLFSALLYRLVERPFRSNDKILQSSIVMIAAIANIGFLGVLYQRLSIPQTQMQVYDAWMDRATYRCGKIHRIIHPFSPFCKITEAPPSDSFRILLVGNSHADSIKSSFSTAANAAGATLFFMVENNPLMPGGMSPQRLVEEARKNRINAIVLHYSPGVIEVETLEQLQRLATQNSMKAAFVMPVPVWKEHVPRVLLQNMETGSPVVQQSIEDYNRFNWQLTQDLQKLTTPNLKVYAVADILCKPECQLISSEGWPLYFDEGHLTLTGASLLTARFAQIISELR